MEAKPQPALLLSLRDAWQLSPGALFGAAMGYLLQGMMPAAQVLVISWLTNALGQSNRSFDSITPTLAAATLIIAFTATLTRIASRLGEHLQNAMRCGYRCRLAETVASFAPARLAEPATMTQVRASQRAIYQLGYLPENVLAVAMSVVGAIALGLVVWRFSPIAGILVLLALLPTVIGFRSIAKVSNQVWPEVSEYERRGDYAMQQLTDLRPATELASLGSGRRVAGVVARWEHAQANALQRMIGRAIRMELLVGLATALLLGGALAALVFGGTGSGDVAASVMGILTGLSAVRGLGSGIGQLMVDSPKLAELHAILDYGQKTPVQSPTAQAVSVVAKGLTVSYSGREEPAIRDVSLEAHPGEMIALVGVNGAGKTTFVNTLLGLLRPQQGTVLIDGKDACQLSDAERLGHFSLLTQEFGRYEFTARESLLLAAPLLAPNDANMWESLKAAKADGFVKALPNELDTQLGSQWGGVGLSGGQWQRLALARIHLRHAGVWVLDEPTSAIDAEAEQEIFSDLLETRQNRTTIVVSHRAWTLRGMDRIYVFDQGCIVEQGNYEELMATRGRFFAIFAAQHA